MTGTGVYLRDRQRGSSVKDDLHPRNGNIRRVSTYAYPILKTWQGRINRNAGVWYAWDWVTGSQR